MSDIFIGIDVGATFIKIGCFDAEMNMLNKTSIPTNAEMGPKTVIDSMCEAVKKMLTDAEMSLDDLKAVGVGTPGPAKYKEGIVIRATNMPKFVNVHITKEINDRLGKPVTFSNDADAACWGEHACGAGKGVEDMVFFTLGTGIGGGIISQGKLLESSGDNAAELGHIIIYPDGRQCNCGQKGCVEAYASASWTAARALEAVQAGEESSLKKVLEDNGKITCKDVYRHLEEGDGLAKRITDETAKALAIVCVNMLHATEPEKIVFAGGMIAAGDILLDRIREYFDEMVWNVKKETIEICFATLGEDAGIIGAADLARQLVK